MWGKGPLTETYILTRRRHCYVLPVFSCLPFHCIRSLLVFFGIWRWLPFLRLGFFLFCHELWGKRVIDRLETLQAEKRKNKLRERWKHDEEIHLKRNRRNENPRLDWSKITTKEEKGDAKKLYPPGCSYVLFISKSRARELGWKWRDEEDYPLSAMIRALVWANRRNRTLDKLLHFTPVKTAYFLLLEQNMPAHKAEKPLRFGSSRHSFLLCPCRREISVTAQLGIQLFQASKLPESYCFRISNTFGLRIARFTLDEYKAYVLCVPFMCLIFWSTEWVRNRAPHDSSKRSPEEWTLPYFILKSMFWLRQPFLIAARETHMKPYSIFN